MTRRSRIDIVVDILKTVNNERTKTQVVYQANLNFKRADRYLQMLQNMGLVEKERGRYRITENGREYLNRFNELNAVFQGV